MNMEWKAKYLIVLAAALLLAGDLIAEPMVLKASKDSFGRSNDRNRNNGGSETLFVAHAPNVRTIIAFDLSGTTNRIVSAVFRFQQQNTMPDELSLVVAPLVQTTHNAAWGEGAGALGTKGQNSRPGEACYAWSAFPEVQWENASGQPVTSLGDSQLWGTPITARINLQWEKGEWVEIKVSDLQWIEAIRSSKNPTLTFGLWGTGGNGLYGISSKESGNAPELVQTLEEKAKDGR